MDIIVFNLSVNVINSDLLKLFSVYGAVSYASVVRDLKNNRSKGIAFLNMPHEAEAEQAIRALNQFLVDGEKIGVQEIMYQAGEFNN